MGEPRETPTRRSKLGSLPTRSVEIDAYLVKNAEARAQALGLSLERYIGNAISAQMERNPLPEEQRRIDEFLSEPGRREWLDSWRQKNALKRPPTMADISAAYKAEDRESYHKYLKNKYS